MNEIAYLHDALSAIRADLVRQELKLDAEIEALPKEQHFSARNLIHYVALRRHDLRDLQGKLAVSGLSSLGRAESHVMANIDAVLTLLARLVGVEGPVPAEGSGEENISGAGESMLDRHTLALLGPNPAGRCVRIMVTMPSEASSDAALVRRLVEAGMNCARINCAHDGPEVWGEMIRNIRQAALELGSPCRIFMDLAGPKIRTGAIEPGAQVLKWKPRRDPFGHLLQPARIWITPVDFPQMPPDEVDAVLPLDHAFVSGLDVGDLVSFKDARGAHRSITIRSTRGASRLAESGDTCYVTVGTRLRNRERGAKHHRSESVVEALPPIEQKIHLEKGDRLILVRGNVSGSPATRDEHGAVTSPARIGCTLASIVDDVAVGQSIWFDDGKIGGIVREIRRDEVEIEIVQVRAGGAKLGADKGINLPETALHLPPLTDKDIEDLRFIVAHADAVCYSFVRSPEDVHALLDLLAGTGGEHLGVVLKIETREGFDRLPEILLATMRSASTGVMIARGDLAIESGFERMAEVQEEILWLSEAAHMPVIWATQVLEQMSKDGMPSRAEITDAAMSERAECVMLNKGAFVVEAVHTLNSILVRMEMHQSKKRSMLRQLGLADRFFTGRQALRALEQADPK